MVFALITIAFVIGMVYRSDFISSEKHQSFWYKYRKLLALVGMTFIPIILINILGTSGHWVTAEENLKDAEEDSFGTDLIAAYEYQLTATPDDIPLYFDYVDASIDELISECTYINFERFTENPEILTIATEYAKMRCRDREPFLDDDFGYKLDFNKTRYINYIRGIQLGETGNFQIAEDHFVKEIELNPGYQKSYIALYEVYKNYKADQFPDFILNSKEAKHLPNHILKPEYFKHGAYGRYAMIIVKERLFNIGLIPFLAGLCISIMWLFFLLEMDVFNKEKWSDLILVFTGGVFFTFFCLPLYDFAHYVLEFRLNGSGWNDFLYCVFVIGGSEELVKLIPWLAFAMFTKKMKEPFDYILYASVAALGFAFAENWTYLEDAENIVVRSIMSTMGHMFDASIIAYALVLARFKIKDPLWKKLVPIIGFALAAIAHGFYDFWLISAAADGMQLITLVFFIITISIWFFFQKNAIGNSRYFTKKTFNGEYQLDILMFSMFTILMIEYIILSIQYGYNYGNGALAGSAWVIAAFLVYMSFILLNFTLKEGWYPFKIPVPKLALLPSFSNGEDYEELDENRAQIIGKELTLYAPKSNRYVGSLLPKNGRCINEFSLGGKPGWYLFELSSPLGFYNHDDTTVIIKCKSEGKSLLDDKVEIYLLLIPKGINLKSEKPFAMSDFRYAGRSYSRPKN
ncbi:MAG: PrsW family intramembrane metalloprotease [Crocinitomicaceae bacterium]